MKTALYDHAVLLLNHCIQTPNISAGGQTIFQKTEFQAQIEISRNTPKDLYACFSSANPLPGQKSWTRGELVFQGLLLAVIVITPLLNELPVVDIDDNASWITIMSCLRYKLINIFLYFIKIIEVFLRNVLFTFKIYHEQLSKVLCKLWI